MKYVYFIQKGTTGPVKIGISGDLRARFNMISTHSDEPITLLAAFAGDEIDERNIQKKFSSFHRRGEWFSPDSMLIKYISDLGKEKDIIDVTQFAQPERCSGGINNRGIPQKGVFFAISDEENAAFHLALERRLKRKIKRGDLTKAGSEALQLWMEKYGISRRNL